MKNWSLRIWCRYLQVSTLAILVTGPSASASHPTLDLTFGVNGFIKRVIGGGFDRIEGVATDSQDRILAVGNGGASNRFNIARYLSNGLPDLSFNQDGIREFLWSTGTPVLHVVPGDKSLIALPDFIEPRHVRAIRLAEDGTNDPAYGVDGEGRIPSPSQVHINDSILQPDGKLITVGSDYFDSLPSRWDGVVARFSPDGLPDTSFGVGGRVRLDFARPAISSPTDRLYASALQPDGKILVGGFSTTTTQESTGNRIHALARLLPDGSLDPTFGTGGKLTFSFDGQNFQREYISHLTVLSDGKILAASGGGSDTALVRLTTNGTIDTSFGVGGRIVAPAGALWSDPTQVLFDPAGGLLLNSSGFFGVPRFGITRLLMDGTVDKSFGDGGNFLVDIGPSQNASILSMSFQDDGKLLLAGSMTTQINQSSAWVLARVNLNLVPEPHTAVLVAFGLIGILSRCGHLAGHIRR